MVPGETLSGCRSGKEKRPEEEASGRTDIFAELGSLCERGELGEELGGRRTQVNVQYIVLEKKDGSYELVEKVYFDHLADFIYVEFMKGMQKEFVPKRCANCGRWFLQEPGMTYNYCGQTAPGETKLTCRNIGSKASFRDKVKNNKIWQIHQRAYKKYFARTKKGTMTKTEFEVWTREETLKNI